MVRTDTGGRFTMDIYVSFEYRMGARAFGEKTGRSEKDAVAPEDKLAPMSLKLKPE